VFGGSDGTNPSRQIFCADVANGTIGGFFNVTGAQLSVPRQDATTVAVGNSVYLVGGSNGSNAIPSIDRVQFSGGGFSAALMSTSLGTARAGAAAVVNGTELHIFGGTNAAGTPIPTTEHALINTDGTLTAFTIGAGIHVARTGAAAVVVGSMLYLVGGTSPSGTEASIERIQLNDDQTLGAAADAGISLATARSGHSVSVLGNFVYAIGGAGSSIDVAPLQ
jgi:hypothetical protein